MADEDVDALETEVGKLQESLGALNVKAPRDGIVVHEDSWQGGKVDVGTQIWRGQSVAQMPDLSTLAVRAALPERELTRVSKGQHVRVLVSGGDRSLSGVIAEIGGTVHSKSRVEAIPVVDLIIHLDQGQPRLKPGQPVQVELTATAGAKR
jgi:multidrug resistance efflux pump